MCAITWPPVAWLAAGTLEWWYRPSTAPDPDVQAIVVLAGGLSNVPTLSPVPLLALDSYQRTEYAVSVFRRRPLLPMLVSGGSIHGSPPVAASMAHLLVSEGVPRELVWEEGQSESTYQNAVRSAEILKARGIEHIGLVTYALHMPRAEAAFRRQGIRVSPMACCFKTDEYSFDGNLFLPSANALSLLEASLHEWVALVWYRISGKI